MFKGFKEFLSRGNVIDLAVAVVIGAAFTGLVTAFTEKVVQPLVDRLGAGGGREYGILKVSLGGDPEQFLDFNAVLSAFINFLIVAAVIYFVIVLMAFSPGVMCWELRRPVPAKRPRFWWPCTNRRWPIRPLAAARRPRFAHWWWRRPANWRYRSTKTRWCWASTRT